MVAHKNIIKYIFIALLFFSLILSIQHTNSEGKIKYTGTFSNIYYHQKSGDLLGVEIRIVLARKGYKGTIQICEGEPSDLILIDPVFRGNKISFTVNSPIYQINFEGTIDSKGISGVSSFPGGGKSKDNLPRKSSYWD